MSLVARIDGIVPAWMLKAPRQTMGKLMAGLGGLLDGFTEAVVQARFAAVPGQVNLPGVEGLGGFDSCDALPLIARDRAVVPALAEPVWDLAARCRSWLDDATTQTGPFGLLDALAEQLVPTVPRLRLVTDNGTISSWYTREPDGTRRCMRSDGAGFYIHPDGTSATDATVAARWIWDDTTVPHPGDWKDRSRFWILVYPPAAGPYLTATDGTCQDMGIVGDLYNDPTTQAAPGSPWAGTVGSNAPIELVERLRAAVVGRRAAGNVCAYFVIAFDPASFNPDGSSTGSPSAYPDGTWGYASATDSTTHVRRPARLGTAEYWPGAPGGRAK